MDPIKQIEKKLGKETYRLSIYYDEDADSPRLNCDNAGKMICWHSEYTLGDEQPKIGPTVWLYTMAECGNENNDEELSDEQLLARIKKKYIILPLFLLDHSGLSMSVGSFNDPWDSGQVGFIYISKKDAIKEWGSNKFTKLVKKKATKYLIGEVETYDQYLRGNVYGYVVEKKKTCNLGHDHWEEVDSCWGFVGDDFKTNGILDNSNPDMVKLFRRSL